MSPQVARTVHMTDPETGEVRTLLKGTEVSDSDYNSFKKLFNNPAIWDDPDAEDLDSLDEEQVLAAASFNATLDPEDVQRALEARHPELAEDGIDDGDYQAMTVPRLRKELSAREIEIPSGATKKADLIALLEEDDAGNG